MQQFWTQKLPPLFSSTFPLLAAAHFKGQGSLMLLLLAWLRIHSEPTWMELTKLKQHRDVQPSLLMKNHQANQQTLLPGLLAFHTSGEI